MEDFSRVHVLEPPEHLVDEVLDVVVRQRLRGADDAVEVRVHELVAVRTYRRTRGG